jgi:hypothetical protein
MVGLKSKWHATRRKAFYDPAVPFFLRMIRTALNEAMATQSVDCYYSLLGSDENEFIAAHRSAVLRLLIYGIERSWRATG